MFIVITKAVLYICAYVDVSFGSNVIIEHVIKVDSSSASVISFNMPSTDGPTVISNDQRYTRWTLLGVALYLVSSL